MNLAGMAGIGIAAALLLFLANPLAGLSTGPWYLPAPWGSIGQILPIGAAGTAVRSAAFYDGSGGANSFLTLTIWVICGFVLSVIVTKRKSRLTASETPAKF